MSSPALQTGKWYPGPCKQDIACDMRFHFYLDDQRFDGGKNVYAKVVDVLADGRLRIEAVRSEIRLGLVNKNFLGMDIRDLETVQDVEQRTFLTKDVRIKTPYEVGDQATFIAMIKKALDWK